MGGQLGYSLYPVTGWYKQEQAYRPHIHPADHLKMKHQHKNKRLFIAGIPPNSLFVLISGIQPLPGVAGLCKPQYIPSMADL